MEFDDELDWSDPEVMLAARRAKHASQMSDQEPSKLHSREAFVRVVRNFESDAQRVSGHSQLVAIADAASAMGAVTGYGLVMGITAKQAANLVKDLRASYKSARHCSNLKQLVLKSRLSPKWCQDEDEHDTISLQVLPYLIDQKQEKAGRRGLRAIPIVGLSESIYAAARYCYKQHKDQLGKERNAMASRLAKHLIVDDCELAEQIVSELFDQEAMLWIKYRCEIEPATAILAARMKSR